MPASSSSAGAAVGQVSVWLYDANRNRVALVDVFVPMPPLILYQGVYYTFHQDVLWGYQATTPFQANADTGLPQVSVVANP